MKPAQPRQFLAQALSELVQARRHLDYSFLIAHDYAGAKAAEIFAYCREQKPVLDAACDRAAEHAANILSLES